jgi:hypothetical protein
MRWGIIFLLLVFSASPRSAEENKWNTVGIRAGFTDQSSEKYFSKYQAYVSFGLPWKWRFHQGWILGTFIQINAGLVVSEGNTLLVSLGPGLYLRHPGKALPLWRVFTRHISGNRDSEQRILEKLSSLLRKLALI